MKYHKQFRLATLLLVFLLIVFSCARWFLQGPQIELSVDTNLQPLPRQIIINPVNPSWLIRENGQPVFLCGPGDPEGFLYRGRRRDDGARDGDQVALINKLISCGGNCIYMQIIRSHGGDGTHYENPFVNSDPKQGLDDDILNQWEEWFRLMDQNDIVIFLFLYDDGADIWNTWRRVGQAELAFIRQIVDRFEHHANLIWVVAEEYSEALSVHRTRIIAQIIRAADDYDHTIAVHKLSGVSFEEFAGDPNIDQFAIQWNKPAPDALHDGVLDAWKIAKGRYNLNMSEAQGHMNDVTAKNWACAMAGSYVMIRGMDIASTAPKVLNECRILKEFFEAADYLEMQPMDELADGATTYVLANPGQSYIAYCRGKKGAVGLTDLSPGIYDLSWTDCITGTKFDQPNVRVDILNPVWKKPKRCGDHCVVWVRKTADFSASN